MPMHACPAQALNLAPRIRSTATLFEHQDPSDLYNNNNNNNNT